MDTSFLVDEPDSELGLEHVHLSPVPEARATWKGAARTYCSRCNRPSSWTSPRGERDRRVPGPPGSHSGAAAAVLVPDASRSIGLPSFSAVIAAAASAEVEARRAADRELARRARSRRRTTCSTRRRSRSSREATLPIRHCLLGLPGSKVDEVTTCRSHPAAFDQCRDLLADCATSVRAAATTADAAHQVAGAGDPTHVAIASPQAADEYELEVLADDVGTSPARSRASSRSRPTRRSRGGEGWRTALSFVTDHQPGALYRALGPLARNNVNLVQLVSRPLPNSPWRYRFDVVLDGHVFDGNVRPALRGAARADARAAPLRVLRRGARTLSARTLFRKVWDAHVVADGEPALLYVDLHLVHEVTSPQAFDGCARRAGRCGGPT